MIMEEKNIYEHVIVATNMGDGNPLRNVSFFLWEKRSKVTLNVLIDYIKVYRSCVYFLIKI